MTDDAPAPDEELTEYASGPSCRHYSDPSDCQIKCARCWHECTQHYQDEPSECYECGCKEWREPE